MGARQCVVVEIANQQANAWFKQHHLQGSTPAHRSFALINDDRIVLAISMGRSRYDKTYSYELLRMCRAPGITVAGG